MEERITENEITFMEFWHDPTAMTENLIPVNIKAPHEWNNEDCELVTVRPYQMAMQNYSYMYADDDELTPKENFERKKGAGTLYNIAARNIGKSFVLFIDSFLTVIHGRGQESCIASFDGKHLKKATNVVLTLFREHPFFEIFRKPGAKNGVKASPVEVDTKHGHTLFGRNENVGSPEPGTDFHSLHFSTFWYEEASYMSKKGTEKRVDSGSSLGYIERLSGIPDLMIGSPLGRILNDKTKKNWICRIPQMVRDDWSETTKKEMIEKYGGENSPAFKLNVLGEIIEGAEGKWDMQRIRDNCYNLKRKINRFEVGKDTFNDFKSIIKLDRLPADKIICASDIGTTGSPSEVCIFFGNKDDKWKYYYQISLFKLTLKEQAEVFKFIYDEMGSCYIALDCSNADGRGIREYLKDNDVPLEHLPYYHLGSKIEVDFERDHEGNVVLDNTGNPKMRDEYTKEWGVQQLEDTFYESKVDIPVDEKFLKQFSGYFEAKSANGRPTWGSKIGEDHLVDSWILFALCAWEKFYKSNVNNKTSKRCLGVID